MNALIPDQSSVVQKMIENYQISNRQDQDHRYFCKKFQPWYLFFDKSYRMSCKQITQVSNFRIYFLNIYKFGCINVGQSKRSFQKPDVLRHDGEQQEEELHIHLHGQELQEGGLDWLIIQKQFSQKKLIVEDSSWRLRSSSLSVSSSTSSQGSTEMRNN